MENAADFAIPDAVTFRVLKGDVLSAIFPVHLPAAGLHPGNKVLPGYRSLDLSPDTGCTLRKIASPPGLQQFPQIPVPGTDLSFFQRRSIRVMSFPYNAQTILFAPSVTHPFHLLQVVFGRMQLMSVCVCRTVDNEMIVQMFLIDVCHHKDLMIRPQLLCKGKPQFMCLCSRNLPRREGQDVVSGKPPAFLPILFLYSFVLPEHPVRIIVISVLEIMEIPGSVHEPFFCLLFLQDIVKKVSQSPFGLWRLCSRFKDCHMSSVSLP